MDDVVEEFVGLGAVGGAVAPRAGKGATGDGRPGNNAYASVLAVGDLMILLEWLVWRANVSGSYHLPLLFTVEKVVVILHADPS